MTAHRCNCGLPAPDTTLCPRCVYILERDLAETPALVEQVDITLSRQTAVTHHDGGRSAETPLPYNVNASEVRANLHGTLVGWVRDMHDGQEFHPADDTADLARWLLARLQRIVVYPAGDQLFDEVTYAIREARRVVDRPRNRSRVFVGGCLDESCPGELWALFPTADYKADDPATHATMTCTECSASYPSHEWLRVGARLLRRTA